MRFFFILLTLVFTARAFAATATGSISGRIFNPATGEYVRNAEVSVRGTALTAGSADDGSFQLTGVPAGAATVTVNYGAAELHEPQQPRRGANDRSHGDDLDVWRKRRVVRSQHLRPMNAHEHTPAAEPGHPSSEGSTIHTSDLSRVLRSQSPLLERGARLARRSIEGGRAGWVLAFALTFTTALFAADAKAPKAPKQPDDLKPQVADGYRGIWYMNQPLKNEYVYKYSGGFATYPQQHVPIAIHVASQRKTFFVFGGSAGNTSEKNDQLQHLVSYYDHATGTVPRPVRLLQKRTEDAHDNPTLSIDANGYLFVFSSAHGTSRPSYIHRSKKPHDIAEWELLTTTNFSYTQPWYLPQSKRFLFLHTLYKNGERTLNWKTSSDGAAWTAPQLLAHIEMGDYQVSQRQADTDRVATAFDLHPNHGRDGKGLNYRTNIYYAETRDGGTTWTTASGRRLTPPLTEPINPALVRDYRADNLSVYLKDIDFTTEGHPVVLYLTSKGFNPGPQSGPFQWHTARWTGNAWEFRPFTTSDHNYDHGSLYIERDGTWRVIAPTAPGPQPHGTGGDMVMWVSRDEGAKWEIAKTLTAGSRYNHTYARKPVNAHPEFYAFWADGSPLEPTPSSLYFATRDGDVYRLPAQMTAAAAKPERVR